MGLEASSAADLASDGNQQEAPLHGAAVKLGGWEWKGDMGESQQDLLKKKKKKLKNSKMERKYSKAHALDGWMALMLGEHHGKAGKE